MKNESLATIIWEACRNAEIKTYSESFKLSDVILERDVKDLIYDASVKWTGHVHGNFLRDAAVDSRLLTDIPVRGGGRNSETIRRQVIFYIARAADKEGVLDVEPLGFLAKFGFRGESHKSVEAVSSGVKKGSKRGLHMAVPETSGVGYSGAEDYPVGIRKPGSAIRGNTASRFNGKLSRFEKQDKTGWARDPGYGEDRPVMDRGQICSGSFRR